VRLRREFRIVEITAANSTRSPLVQVADLFGGLAVFSREKFDEYDLWLKETSAQAWLFERGDSAPDPSRSSRERFQVLAKFDGLCKKRKLGVSLKTKRGLWTPNPENPVNFWPYEPQHAEDKAPQKR
jgi:hypothetical protein